MNSFKATFARLFLVISISISVLFFIGVRLTTNDIKTNFEHDMREKWGVINELNLANTDQDVLNKHLTAIGKDTNSRITIIAPNGIVLNDSATPYDKIKELQNHKQREEVMGALNGNPGFSVRMSATTKYNSIYYAKRGNDGNVLRISYEASALTDELSEYRKNVYGVYISLLILILLASAYFANKFTRPIKALDKLSKQILSGNTEDIHFPDFNDQAIDNIASAMYSIYKNYTTQERDMSFERKKINTIFSSMKEGIILIDDGANITYMNDNAKGHLNHNIDVNTNVLDDVSDIDLILFFKEVLRNKESEKRRIKLGERIFDLYSRTIASNTLVVFDEVTESAQYEAFKSELVGNITHEIKTPLALMLGASETIINDPEMDTETRNKFLASIFRNSKDLNNLINETLDLHKLEAEHGTIIVEAPANLQATVEDADMMIVDKNGKNITFNVPQVDVMVRGEHILSIISNLVNNAIKYSKGENIDVTIEHTNSIVRIAVEDEGPAIPENEQKRIFERFYTVSKARTRGRSGSGIGLAIVKHIAKQYNGSASVHTNNKNGNTFVVTLVEKK